MRVHTGRTPMAHLGQADTDVFSLETLPNLRRRYVIRKNGNQVLPKYAKVGPLVQNTNEYIFLRDQSGQPVRNHLLTLIDWTNAPRVDPVTYVAPAIAVSEYNLVPKAQENAFLSKLPMPNIPAARMMATFWKATAESFERAQKSLLDGQDRDKFAQAELSLISSKGYRDQALVELDIITDIEVYTPEELKNIKVGIFAPLIDIINQGETAVVKGQPGVFESTWKSIKGFLTSSARSYENFGDERWMKFLRFYRSLETFEAQARMSIDRIKALGVSPAVAESLQALEAQIQQIRIVRQRIDSGLIKEGVPLDKVREAAAGLGVWPAIGMILKSPKFWQAAGHVVLFLVLADIWRVLGIGGLVGSILGVRAAQVHDLKEQLRIHHEAQTQIEAEVAAKNAEKTKEQLAELDKVQGRLSNVNKYLEQVVGRSMPMPQRQALDVPKVTTPSGIQEAPSALPYVLAGVVGLAVVGVYYATREKA